MNNCGIIVYRNKHFPLGTRKALGESVGLFHSCSCLYLYCTLNRSTLNLFLVICCIFLNTALTLRIWWRQTQPNAVSSTWFNRRNEFNSRQVLRFWLVYLPYKSTVCVCSLAPILARFLRILKNRTTHLSGIENCPNFHQSERSDQFLAQMPGS